MYSSNATPASYRPPVAGEVMFHVLMGPNDQRRLTLDQVDDCYRLGVIDEGTLVWAEGMTGWETLADAAGLTAPAPEPRGAPARRKPPPPPRRPRPAARPSAALPPLTPPGPTPLGTSHGYAPAAAYEPKPSGTYPRAMPQKVQPPIAVGLAPAQPAFRPVAAMPPQALLASEPSRAVLGALDSHLETDVVPPRNALDRARAYFQATAVWVAFLAGTCVALYRTDVFYQAAGKLGHRQQFLSLEQRWLGGPPTDVPREIEALARRRQELVAAAGPFAAGPSTAVPSAAAPSAAAPRRTASAPPEPSQSTTSDAWASESAAVGDAPRPDPDASEPTATVNSLLPVGQPAAAVPVVGRVAARRPMALRSSAAPAKRSPAVDTVAKSAGSAAKGATGKKAKAADLEPNALEMGSEEFLKWSMRHAVKKSKTGKKKSHGAGAGPAPAKASGAAYDPLNGDL